MWRFAIFCFIRFNHVIMSYVHLLNSDRIALLMMIFFLAIVCGTSDECFFMPSGSQCLPACQVWQHVRRQGQREEMRRAGHHLYSSCFLFAKIICSVVDGRMRAYECKQGLRGARAWMLSDIARMAAAVTGRSVLLRRHCSLRTRQHMDACGASEGLYLMLRR